MKEEVTESLQDKKKDSVVCKVYGLQCKEK